jgi:hypothetical protein
VIEITSFGLQLYYQQTVDCYSLQTFQLLKRRYENLSATSRAPGFIERLATQMESNQLKTQEISEDDNFVLRLRLLVKMAKDCLYGGELSSRRRQIMLENARRIELDSIELGHLNKELLNNLIKESSVFVDICFYRYAYELAVLIKSVANRTPMDSGQKSNLKEILEALRVILSTNIWKQRLHGLSRRFFGNHVLDNFESLCTDSPAPEVVH